MRITVVCLSGMKNLSVRRWNVVWRKYGQFYDKPCKVPPALIEKGVEIVDMKDYMLNPPQTKWKPPVPDDPRWAEPIPLEDQPDWKPEPAFSTDKDVQIYEGVDQACLIAKAQHFKGLPPGVERLMGAVEIPNKDVLLQRYIMLSQEWNTDEQPQPTRQADPEQPLWVFRRSIGVLPQKASLILMRNLLRMCGTQRAGFPSLASRKQISEPLLDSHIMYRDQAIVQREELDFLLTSDTWLPPFGNEDLMDASVAHKLPNMWPVLPTVDFPVTNNYELHSYPGFKKPHKFWCPHTIVQIPHKVEWSDSHYQATQILTSLQLTAAVARQRFGDEVLHLPEPICVQHALLNQNRLYLTFFQLNTLDLSKDSGVKNLVWTASPTQFFHRRLSRPWLDDPEEKKSKLESYEGSAFDPLLAAYLYGVPELVDR